MSGYQYYEFCKINAPLTADARKEMYSLSSRANITTHGASYVYNYGDFRGNSKALLLKYFDVFFYISNFGCIQLMFKYSVTEVNAYKLKQYCIDEPISCEITDTHVLLDIDYNNEEGFSDWIEGEEMLIELLPLYDEIKSGNYEILRILADVCDGKTDILKKPAQGNDIDIALSEAQEAFLKFAELDHILINE